MAVRLDGIVEITNDVLAGRVVGDVREVLAERPARHRHAIAVQKAAVQEAFHQWLDSPDLDEFRHQVTAAGFYVGQYRDPGADTGKVVEPEPHAGFVGHRDKVQDRVR